MSRATELAKRLSQLANLEANELADVMNEAADELERLDRVNAELAAQNEAQKDEWLSWDAKRKDLERDSARYRWLRTYSKTGIRYRCGENATANHFMLSGKELDGVIDSVALTSSGEVAP